MRVKARLGWMELKTTSDRTGHPVSQSSQHRGGRRLWFFCKVAIIQMPQCSSKDGVTTHAPEPSRTL